MTELVVAAQPDAERPSAPADSTPPEAPRTEVNDSKGPIHTGTGDQLNDIRYYEQRPRKPRTWDFSQDKLEQRWKSFVPPPGFDRAAGILADRDGLVILSGAVGTGRSTAGLMLLRAGMAPGTAVRFVAPDLEKSAAEAERRIFEGSDVRDDDRLMLDLSDVDGEAFGELQDYLQALQSALLQRQAKLVTILPHLHGERLNVDLLPFEVKIGRPDMFEVLQRQLAAEGLTATNLSAYRESFASSSIEGLVRIVYQVRNARRDRPEIPVDVLLSEVLDSAEKRADTIARCVQSVKDVRGRALLLTVALLHGLSTHTVSLAHERLLGLLRGTEEDADHALDVPGLEQMLASITLDLSVTPEPGQRLHFADQEMPAEVLRYFWDDMPWLRGPLTDWVGELVRTGVGALDRFDMATLARRFGAQCRRTRDTDLAFRLVTDWSGDRYQSQRSAAYTLLEDLLDDDGTASAARQLLYNWTRDTHLPDGRVAIVVAACVNILADRYLDQAVVRLAWLAEHSEYGVRRAAREGLGQLAAEPRRRLQVIDYVLERWRFDPAGFAAVAAPAGLPMFLGTEAVERIVAGWHRALTETDQSRRAALFRPWLTAHAEALGEERPGDAQAVQQLLAMVCAHQPDLLDALFNTALDWLEYRSDDPLRLRTVQSIEQLVRRGRRPAAPTLSEAGQ
ncbi:hypothetical protein GCM10009745_47160 [Kribbella yunnanensis]|uniref:HEAT repeat domain-containing protein n=1 Tax=Kribbella yunnanensis TaxID=190194 RepID=A0ABN2HZ65_9ACTN